MGYVTGIQGAHYNATQKVPSYMQAGVRQHLTPHASKSPQCCVAYPPLAACLTLATCRRAASITLPMI